MDVDAEEVFQINFFCILIKFSMKLLRYKIFYAYTIFPSHKIILLIHVTVLFQKTFNSIKYKAKQNQNHPCYKRHHTKKRLTTLVCIL